MQNVYASFWRRLVAFIIDNIVISFPTMLLSGVLAALFMPQLLSSMEAEPSPQSISALLSTYGFVMLLNLVSALFFWLYYAFMESSAKQATLGKMAMGIKVVDEHGQRISFARATGRTFAKIISYTILYFGFFMAAFTKKRQALHDLIATTYVVNAGYQPDGQPLPQEKFRPGCLILTLLAILIPIVLWFALMGWIITTGLKEANTATRNPHQMVAEQMKALAAQNTQTQPVELDGFTITTQEDGVYATPANTLTEFKLFIPYGGTDVCCQTDEDDDDEEFNSCTLFAKGFPVCK